MFPEGNSFITTTTPPTLLPPHTIEEDDRISYSYGGIALNDASQGLMALIWRARLDCSRVYLSNSSDGYASESLLYGHSVGADRVGLSFDNNMQPVLLLYYDNTAVVRFYDGGEIAFIFQTVSGVRGARIVMDYPWRGGNEIRDTLVCYVRNSDDKLYYRRSRDRYLFEYEIQELDQFQTLRGVYATTDKRVAFRFAWDPKRKI